MALICCGKQAIESRPAIASVYTPIIWLAKWRVFGGGVFGCERVNWRGHPLMLGGSCVLCNLLLWHPSWVRQTEKKSREKKSW